MIIAKEGQEEAGIIPIMPDYNEINPPKRINIPTFQLQTLVITSFKLFLRQSRHLYPDTCKEQRVCFFIMSELGDFLCFMILGGLQFHLFFFCRNEGG